MISTLLSALWTVVSWFFSPIPLTLITASVGLVYFYITKEYNFWSSRGIPGPTPKFPWGQEFGAPFMQPFVEFHDWLYYKQGGKNFCGLFEVHRPVLEVGDPDLIRSITIKDFEHFINRRDTTSKDFEMMLSELRDNQWKETRSVMSPAFSSSKLRAMHQLCLDNAANLNKYLGQAMIKDGKIEMKDAFGRFTMDNIASCAFGVNCNSFVDPNTEFAHMAGELFKTPSGYGMFLIFALMLLPRKISHSLPDPATKIHHFFRNVVTKTIEYRESNGTSRRDFLQLLAETKNKHGERILSMDSIVAQSVLFFIAGYDTTSTLLTFAGYSLATSPDCQEKVQQEIDQALARHGGQLSYEAVAEMSYLDRVLAEALRLYPPAAVMERECNKEWQIPGTSATIPPGTLVQIPVFAIHRDPDIYPDPLKFDPDRFLPEEKEKRHPCTWLPFGSGPRNCIAMRFALFETKVALAAVLKENTLAPTPNTPPPPMPLDTKAFLLSPITRDASSLRIVSRNTERT